MGLKGTRATGTLDDGTDFVVQAQLRVLANDDRA
jgi:hypothetical protein